MGPHSHQCGHTFGQLRGIRVCDGVYLGLTHDTIKNRRCQAQVINTKEKKLHIIHHKPLLKSGTRSSRCIIGACCGREGSAKASVREVTNALDECGWAAGCFISIVTTGITHRALHPHKYEVLSIDKQITDPFHIGTIPTNTTGHIRDSTGNK